MALETRAKFYYGVRIPVGANYIAFQDFGSLIVKTAKLKVGSYSLTGFANEIARAMHEIANQTYTVSFNRTTRRITISSTANFTILISTGPYAGSQIYSIMGFSLASNLTGSSSYTGTSAVGKEYKPQFYLLDYVDTERSQESVDASINETAGGNVEVIRYGTKKFMKCTIDFVTNEKNGQGSWIEDSWTGVEDTIEFLQDITQKTKLEFMPDRDKPDTFQTFILESTSSNRNGLGYELTEKSGEGFINYYSAGRLVFRLIE